MNTSISLSYSPFSDRAKWALRTAEVDFKVREHTPMMSALRLRKALGKWRGKVSVPVLLHDGEATPESVAIAQWAAAQSPEQGLIPDENRALVSEWEALSTRMLEAGRVRVTQRVLRSKPALVEHLPKGLRWLGPLGLPIAKTGSRYLLGKYPIDADPAAVLREGCERLRAGLAGNDYLVGDHFSFADIVMATALQFVRPVERADDPIGPSSRACWTAADLADEFTDLLDWRDQIYARHW